MRKQKVRSLKVRSLKFRSRKVCSHKVRSHKVRFRKVRSPKVRSPKVRSPKVRSPKFRFYKFRFYKFRFYKFRSLKFRSLKFRYLLRSILGTLKEEPDDILKKELSEWVKFMNKLHKQSISLLKPDRKKSLGKGAMEIGQIMRYQGITEAQMQEALKIL